MSTDFTSCVIISMALAACGRPGQPPLQAVAAPSDNTATGRSAREWTSITVDGAYGPIELQVPALVVTAAPGARSSILIDSIALRQVERRLTARLANIARAEAAALLSDTAPRIVNPRHLAEPIKPGLLGAIPFSADSVVPTSAGRERIMAVARLAEQLAGSLEIVVEVQGTGGAVFDLAMMRARRVYAILLEAAPSLAQREVRLSVHTRIVNPGAPRLAQVVEVFTIGTQ